MLFFILIDVYIYIFHFIFMRSLKNTFLACKRNLKIEIVFKYNIVNITEDLLGYISKGIFINAGKSVWFG